MHQQQGEHLDGFAQSHVVGEAGAESELRQQVQPADPDLLIGAQRAVQVPARVDPIQCFRGAQGAQGFRQPGAGDGSRPFGILSRGAFAGDVGAGHHAHGFGKGDAFAGRELFEFAELLHGPGELLAVDFHPASPDQRQAVGLGKEFVDFGLRQPLAVEDHFDGKIEQGIRAEAGGGLAPDRRGHSRPGRPAGTPGGGHAHHDPRGFEFVHVLQKTKRLRRRPADRVEDLVLVHHGAQPGAALGGPLDGQQQ